MCGRFSQAVDQDKLYRRFQARAAKQLEIKPRYNVPPSVDVPVIVFSKDGPTVETMAWGIPSKRKGEKTPHPVINLRSDTIAKGAFKSTLLNRRILVPADGFYEWRHDPGGKWPVRFTRRDEKLFALAGMYEEPNPEYGPAKRSFTIFTTEPNEVVRPVHDRMPVILDEADEAEWLDPENQDFTALVGLLRPYPGDLMKGYDVSQALNSPKNDRPEVIHPVKRATERDLFSF